jgi:hypothetical protein
MGSKQHTELQGSRRLVGLLRRGPTPERRRPRWGLSATALLAPLLVILLVLLQSGGLAEGSADLYPSGVSLAGVHWYSGDSNMIDTSAPWGQRGWTVEAIYSVDFCDGNKDTPIGDINVRSKVQTARDKGLATIVRVDYRGFQAVPTDSGQYDQWVTKFNQCIQELSDLTSLFIVGNEPNLEGGISAAQYASAFNYLYARKQSGSELLVAGPSGFSPIEWLGAAAGAISNADGFALHTYGDPTSIDIHGKTCSDPRLPCKRSASWNFDGGFLYFKDLINQLPSKFNSKPVFITEFNTDVNGRDQQPNPRQNYPSGWVTKAFSAVRDYNANRGSKPRVLALIWYVDRDDGGWGDYALRNITDARSDMACEFKNPINRGGSANTCPIDGQPPTSTPTPPPVTSGAIESITAYGRFWDFDAGNGELSSSGDLTDISRYRDGPCNGNARGACTFDTRTFVSISGHIIESITAYGGYWNFVVDDGYRPWPSGDLTDVARYRDGPCSGKSRGTCNFDTRTVTQIGGHTIESITAYGGYWNFVVDQDYQPWPSGDLTDVARYRDGPCNGKARGTCTFDTREIFVNADGHRIELITAYGRWYGFDTDDNYRRLPNSGKDLSQVPPYSSGPCQGKSGTCRLDTLAMLNAGPGGPPTPVPTTSVPPTPVPTTPPPTGGGARLHLLDPSQGVQVGQWITQCISLDLQRVWQVSSDLHWADYKGTEYPWQHDCGSPGNLGMYPLVFRDSTYKPGAYATWCVGSGHTRWVWLADGTYKYVPFAYPEDGTGECP